MRACPDCHRDDSIHDCSAGPGSEITVSRLVEESYETSKSKGWHDSDADERTLKIVETARSLGADVDRAFRDLVRSLVGSGDATVGDRFMLMVSEVSEALEEYRGNQPLDRVYFMRRAEVGNEEADWLDAEHPLDAAKIDKPEGIPIELADVLIRIGDFCGKHGIDLERAVRIKLAFNKTRPHRHGGKKI